MKEPKTKFATAPNKQTFEIFGSNNNMNTKDELL